MERSVSKKEYAYEKVVVFCLILALIAGLAYAGYYVYTNPEIINQLLEKVRKERICTVSFDSNGGQCNVRNWTDIVAISAESTRTVGLRSDGTVVAVGYNKSGVCEVSGWKLFDNYENLDQERKAARQKRLEEERIAEQRRNDGLCQHCGDSFKGLFTKKCVNCGKPKDY